MYSVDLFYNGSDEHVINKVLTPVASGVSCDLKAPIDVEYPVITIAATDAYDRVNYAYIAEFGRYYYVKPVVYDKVLCLRLARDGRQIKIMDTIYSNLYVDLNYINDFAMSSSLITDCIMDVTKSFESQKQSIELVIDLEIKKFIRDMSK